LKMISAAEQRTVELAATKLGLSISDMINNAGRAAFEYISKGRELSGTSAAILCGGGGNAADGFVIARHMAEAGARPVIVLCSGTPSAEAPATAYARAIDAGVPVLDINIEYDGIDALLSEAAIVVDAVFGLGFKGQLPPAIAELFDAVNTSDAEVISIDIPSGIDADSGTAARHSIRADITLAVVGKKPAHIFKSSVGYCGSVEFLDIGIPAEAYGTVTGNIRILDAGIASDIIPDRDETTHKWTCGSVVCLAGCDRYRGAAVLCAKGALAGGAGLVSVISTPKTLDAVAANCPEVILLDIDSDDEGISAAFSKATCFVMGCGLDIDASRHIVARIVNDAACPIVIDAEGIKAISHDIEIIKGMPAPVILTPHIGEFAGLAGTDAATVYQNRVRMAREYAVSNKVIVVLKSDNTVVALPNSDVYINTAGNSGLAKGGSGDLLSGVIGSLCAMDVPADKAALLGVYLHSRAADIATRYFPKHSITPSIVAGYISTAVAEVSTMK